MAHDMQPEVLDMAVGLLMDNGHQAQLRRDYSGRGMYGATCYGIVAYVSLIEVNRAIRRVVRNLVEDGYDELMDREDEFELTRIDSMGKGYIYY